MSDELRRLLHDAFDGERPRPGVVDEIVQKAQAGVAPRRRWHLRLAPLAAGVAIPVATAAAAVAFGITHHSAGNGGGVGTPPTHAPATAQPSPRALPGIAAPAHFIPWLPVPPDTAASTASPAAIPPGTPACSASQLEGAALRMSAAAGNENLPIGLRNRGTIACVLDGRADLRIDDSGGRVLAQAVGSAGRGTFFDSDPSSHAVLLLPGTPPFSVSPSDNGSGYAGQASINVQWVDCGGPTAHTATLDLPASGGRLVVPFRVQATQDAGCFTQTHAPQLFRGPFRAVSAEMVQYQLQTQIAAPAQARAGSTLTFYVTLTNRSPVAYGFDPCPAYYEVFESSSSTTKPQLTSLALNCSPAGTLAPRASLTFEMRIDVPRDLSGTTQLTWDLFSLVRTPPASAAIDVLPASG